MHGMEIVIVIIVALVSAGMAFADTPPNLSSLIGRNMGANLSPAQIAVYAQQAGFTGQDLISAVAIAIAESSGNPKANGDTNLTPGGSVGLWQINLAAHPEFAGLDLTDPQTNANAAYSVYMAAGYSFYPWSTYKSGAYARYVGDAAAGVNV